MNQTINEIVNLTSRNIIELNPSTNFPAVMTVTIALGALMIGGWVYINGVRDFLKSVEKELKGTEFIKALKRRIFFDYNYWMKISLIFAFISLLLFLSIIYKLLMLVMNNSEQNTNHNFAPQAILTLSCLVISFVISILINFNRSNIEEYRDGTSIDDIKKINGKHKADLMKISIFWDRTQFHLENSRLKEAIIQTVASVLDEEKEEKK